MPEEQQVNNKIDDYMLIGVIGNGKTCQVHEAMHEQSGAMVAMKLMLPEAMADAEEKALLKHEGKVAQQFEHPNLIRCNGIVMRKTECYLLLDLFKTPNLKLFIHADRAAVQCRMKKLIEGVCAGLGHMHDKGWIHKDLKPDNILMNRSAEVRLIDFSLAVRKSSAISKVFSSKKGVIRGTRTYLAPETIRKEGATPATDIYSLGISLYECLTGKPPFTGESPQDLLKRHLSVEAPPPSLLNDNVTPEMDAVILKMLAKKPKERFQECSEIVSAISNISMFREEPVEGHNSDEDEDQSVSEDEATRLKDLMDGRLDSRTDAKVRKMLEDNPALKKTYQEIKEQQVQRQEARAAEIERRRKKLSGEKAVDEKPAAKKKRPAAAAPPTPQPAPGYFPQAPVPQPYGMPQPGYPQMPQAGYPQMPQQPGMPQPGYPQMPQQPGMPQPGYPQMPQQPGMPQPGYPQMPQQQGMPQPGYPQMPQQPGMPQPGYPQTPQQPGAPQPQNQPGGAAAPQQADSGPAETPEPPDSDDGMEFMMELPDVE